MKIQYNFNNVDSLAPPLHRVALIGEDNERDRCVLLALAAMDPNTIAEFLEQLVREYSEDAREEG